MSIDAPYDLTLLPPNALKSVARVMAHGNSKYAEWDWSEKNSRENVRAAIGHLLEWLARTDVDGESGEHPFAHTITRLMLELEKVERGKDIGEWRMPK